MAIIGKNIRITVEESRRIATRKLFTEVLGCSMITPMPALEVYVFGDGLKLGAYYVPDGNALPQTEHMKAPWLEVCVDDVEKTTSKLEELGIVPFEYMDKAHAYFCPPSGPVFRLAKSA